MPIVANSATRSKSVPLTLERKRDNEFVEFIIIIYISTFELLVLLSTHRTMSCSYSVSSIGLFPFAGLFPFVGLFPFAGLFSIAGLHSLNHFVSHNFHVSSFGYTATFVLSVAIVW